MPYLKELDNSHVVESCATGLRANSYYADIFSSLDAEFISQDGQLSEEFQVDRTMEVTSEAIFRIEDIRSARLSMKRVQNLRRRRDSTGDDHGNGTGRLVLDIGFQPEDCKHGGGATKVVRDLV